MTTINVAFTLKDSPTEARCTVCGLPILNFMGYGHGPKFCECKHAHHASIPKGCVHVIKEHKYRGFAGKR